MRWKTALFTIFACSLFVNSANSHLTVDCPTIKPKTQAKLADGELLENGLWFEQYDTNRDGKMDMATLSHMLDHEKHNAHPLFYLVDRDFDGNPDEIWIDKVGEGKCEDIVLYQDLTVPHDTGLNFQHPQEGKGRDI